jgi:sRNA-binding carbon storage regulator CsrA
MPGLTLTRREDEAIVLQTADGEIVIFVRRDGNRRLVLTVEAPESVTIVREELLTREGGQPN